jgi:hypothetical protein
MPEIDWLGAVWVFGMAYASWRAAQNHKRGTR